MAGVAAAHSWVSWLFQNRVCAPIPTLHLNVTLVAEHLENPRLQTARITQTLVIDLGDKISKAMLQQLKTGNDMVTTSQPLQLSEHRLLILCQSLHARDDA